jgi:ketosteroid isomerase-like protein
MVLLAAGMGLSLLNACHSIAAGQTSGPVTESERASIAAAVEQRVQGYFDATRRKDLDYLLGFWATDTAFVMASDGKVTAGYNGIASSTRKWLDGVRIILSSSKSNGHIYVLGRDAASYTTDFEWSYVSVKGDTVRSRGSWVYVFKRFGDAWRVVQSGGTHIGG